LHESAVGREGRAWQATKEARLMPMSPRHTMKPVASCTYIMPRMGRVVTSRQAAIPRRAPIVSATSPMMRRKKMVEPEMEPRSSLGVDIGARSWN
jgi:hypothetical protein